MLTVNYRSNLLLVILSILVMAIFVNFVTWPILLLIFMDLKLSEFLKVLLVYVSATFIFPIISMIVMTVKLEITNEGIVYQKLFRKKQFVSFQDRVTYTAIVKRPYGVYTHKTRTIMVFSSGGDVVQLHLSFFAKKDFSEIGEELKNRARIKKENLNEFLQPVLRWEEGVASLPPEGLRFMFPREEQRQYFTRPVALIAGILLGVALLANIYFYLNFGVPDIVTENTLFQIHVALVMFSVAVAGVVLFLTLRLLIMLKRTPKSIFISNTVLKIDNDAFILSDIRRIKMTKPLMTKLPEDMKIGKRYLVVTTAHQTKRYILGYICSNGGKPFYPEYPSVVCAIQVFLRNSKMALTWFKSELGPEPE